MRNNNGHNDFDSQFHSITSHIVMPGAKPFSRNITSREGRKTNGSAKGRWAESSNKVQEPIGFRAFPDGTLVELVSDPSDLSLRLLIWKNGKTALRADFRYADRSFVPPTVDPGLMRATRLPRAPMPNANVGDLLHGLQDCISTYIDLQPQSVRLVSNFILFTWFADTLTVAPYLWVTGPYSAGKTKLLRLLHCLCRRAVLANDLTPASLYLLPTVIMPTLLMDEFESCAQIRHHDVLRFLRSGSTQGGQVFRAGKPYDTFCAKVIASRQGPTDAALASRAVSVSMLPTHRSLPELDPATQEKIASQFQGQLLSYRLQNYSRISTSVDPDFTPRLKDLARALAAPLLGHQQLEQQLIEDLQPQDDEAKMARNSEPEWAVATALYERCHATNGILTVGCLTNTVNDVLSLTGETYVLQPRAVGNFLRSLGLQTCKVGNLGRGLRMTQELKMQAHKLASDLGIKRADILNYQAVDAGYGGLPCGLCDKYGLLVREDGTKLRCVDPFKARRDKYRRRQGLYGNSVRHVD